MQNSPAIDREGEPIEEVLPAAIGVTATSEKATRAGGELARRQSTDEPRMAVMRAGSPALTNVLTNLAGLPGGLVVAAAAALLLALIVLAVVVI